MYVLMNNTIVPYDDARIHVLTSGFKYGAAVFEGIRGYTDGITTAAIFRLDDHITRLFRSAYLMRMDVRITRETIVDGILSIIAKNETAGDFYVRVILWLGGDDGTMLDDGPVEWCAAVRATAKSPRTDNGIHVGISSWRRLDAEATPPRIKATGNYINGRIGGIDGAKNGYDDVLFLNRNGFITEGPATNVFLVSGRSLITPPLTSGILSGITRDTVLTLADDLGLDTTERDIDRVEISLADEVFACGTWHEITPVLSIDRLKMVQECRGRRLAPSKRLMKTLFAPECLNGRIG